MAILKKHGKRIIDLDGPAGNAFALIGQAVHFARQFGQTKEQIDALTADMKSGDYEHLLVVFDKHFGSIVDLVRSETNSEEDNNDLDD